MWLFILAVGYGGGADDLVPAFALLDELDADGDQDNLGMEGGKMGDGDGLVGEDDALVIVFGNHDGQLWQLLVLTEALAHGEKWGFDGFEYFLTY